MFELSQIIEPQTFNDYVIEKTAELSALIQSNILQRTPEFDALARSGGRTVNMPFWQDLTGEDEVLQLNEDLDPEKFQADQDIAVILRRGKAWKHADLLSALAGDDPMRDIGDMTARWWNRRIQKIVLAILEGIFLETTMEGHIFDGIGAEFSHEGFIYAKAKLGDAQDRLTGLAVHSNTYAKMQKLDLVWAPEPDQKPFFKGTFMGHGLIVDDSIPFDTVTGETISYLFGEGAFAYGVGTPKVPVETFRNALGGEDGLVHRRHMLLHPRGVAWQDESVALTSPDNDELADDSNWERVWEPKNVRIVAYVHDIAELEVT